MQEGYEGVIILDGAHKPLGVVKLSHWLYDKTQHDHVLTMPIHSILYDPLSFERGWVEGVAIAHADWSLDQFQRHVVEASEPTAGPWVVMDGEYTCLGLLDECAVWRAIALQSRSSSSAAPSTQDEGCGGDRPVSSTTTPQSPPSDSSSQRLPISHTWLAQIIDRVPLPLMIQTSDGSIIAQNQAWQQQLQELQDPLTIQRQIAALLDHESPSKYRTNSLPEPVLCNVGADSNECVCLCPMKNGQERVWQFSKVPLLPHSEMVPSANPQPVLQSARFTVVPSAPSISSASLSDNPFQLAQLAYSPHDIAQTAPHHDASHGENVTEHLWLVIAQDTTEQQQLANELSVRNANLAKANHSKDEFLRCVTHELKTPLTAMLGLSSLLKDHAIGPLNERQTQYAQLIHRSGRQLVSLVNNILSLTRVETGQCHLNVDVVDIRTICEQAYKEALETYCPPDDPDPSCDDVSHLHFDLDIPPELQHTVADSLRLKQMLVQLLSNALKFSHADGHVGVRVRLWNHWLAFTVWDTGIGIPPDKQHLIFQKFQQLEHPLTRSFKGAGLGLVLVQKLARLHGGDISFTSEEGKGSQFTILLPSSPIMPDHQPPNEQRAIPQRGRRLQDVKSSSNSQSKSQAIAQSLAAPRLALIVESQPLVLDQLIQYLTSLEYRIIVARSGTEALDKIRLLQPNLILLDLALPLLSGWDVLMILKADLAMRHIPVVTLSTAYETARAKEAGANGVLEHPVSLAALQRVLSPLVKPAPVRFAKPVTILYLNPESKRNTPSVQAASGERSPAEQVSHGRSPERQSDFLSTEKLNILLHPHHCRVLEVDDIFQAGLLSNVWKPDVILLGNAIPDPDGYLETLRQNNYLSKLPIVTLNMRNTQAANRVLGLKVFPCLNLDFSQQGADAAVAGLSPLVEGIQIAAGIHQIPRITILRASDLVDHSVLSQGGRSPTSELIEQWKESRLLASVQYLQGAGFHVTVGTSVHEIMTRIEQHTIDVLLLCMFDAALNASALTDALEPIKRLNGELPIVAWADGNSTELQGRFLGSDELIDDVDLQGVVTDVVWGLSSIDEVLAAVRLATAHYRA